MFNTIRQRMMLYMMMAGFVPLLILLFTAHTMLQRALHDSEREKVSDATRNLAKLVTEVMDRSARDLRSLATNPLLADPDADPEAQLVEMRRLVGVYQAFSDISLYGKDGFLINSTTENHPVFQDYSAWFKEALKGKTIISNPQRKLGADGLYLNVYLPTVDSLGNVRQVVKARLSFERVMNLLKGVKIGKAGSLVMLDAWGNIICDDDNSRLLEKFDPALPSGHWQVNAVDEYHGPRGNFLYSAETLSAEATHVGSPWTLVAMKPMVEVNALMGETLKTFALAVAAFVFVASGFGVYFANKISRPIESACQVAAEVASGNMEARMQTTGPKELRKMAAMFNGMVQELRQHRYGLERLVRHRTDSLRRSQEKLLRISAHLRAAINSTNNGFLVTDAEGRIAQSNPLFGLLVGMVREATVGNPADTLIRMIGEKSSILQGAAVDLTRPIPPDLDIDIEIRMGGPGNRILHVFSAPLTGRRGEWMGRVWTLQDLTDQRSLEEGLRQSQKMEAVGQLAGGVAHDFNNLLTGILGNLALVELELEQKAGITCQDNLHHAVRAGERAAELVKQLLGFSRRSQLSLTACDANNVMTEVRNILTATLDPGIHIELALAGKPWKTMADVNMLSQVIMNMAVNAKDAMPKGGTLRLGTGNQFISAVEASQIQDASPGQYLRLTIEDDGEGIPMEIQARIFEPFFTTKPPGKGTGLGLATSFGIIKQLGGWIELYSKPGFGTRFDIFLPRHVETESPAMEEAVAPPPAAAPAVPSGNHETILIVDDEEVVRRVAAGLFTKLGYEVLIARDGREGLEMYAKHRHQIDLIVMDLTMPNLSGKETFRMLREQYGYMPVLICSGYLLDLKEFERECGAEPDGFIQKPYKFETMSSTVRRVLDRKMAAA